MNDKHASVTKSGDALNISVGAENKDVPWKDIVSRKNTVEFLITNDGNKTKILVEGDAEQYILIDKRKNRKETAEVLVEDTQIGTKEGARE
jgi:hypothetical protein